MRVVRRCTRRDELGWAIALALALGLAGCSGDVVKPYEPITDPAQLYLGLALNYGAVNLSTAPGYNTVQLTATPLNALGEPLSGLPAPTFHATDTAKVTVSPTGLVTALKTGTNILVFAELTTADNVYHVDTAYVNIVATNPPPELATLTIDPVPPDSAIWPVLPSTGSSGATDLYVSSFFTGPIIRTVSNLKNYLKTLTAGGTAIANLQVEYASLDSTVASVNRRTGVTTRRIGGSVRMIARTYAYGVAKADTTVFTLTPPIFQTVVVGQGVVDKPFESVVIRQGGYVYWANRWQPVDVVFDDPSIGIAPTDTACTIATTYSPQICNADMAMDAGFFLLANGYRVRRFMNPGTYPYRDRLSGETAKVVVLDSTAWGQ